MKVFVLNRVEYFGGEDEQYIPVAVSPDFITIEKEKERRNAYASARDHNEIRYIVSGPVEFVAKDCK